MRWIKTFLLWLLSEDLREAMKSTKRLMAEAQKYRDQQRIANSNVWHLQYEYEEKLRELKKEEERWRLQKSEMVLEEMSRVFGRKVTLGEKV